MFTCHRWILCCLLSVCINFTILRCTHHIHDRSAVMKNLSDLIIYRRKYAAHKELWSQLLLVWAEACHIYCDHVITAKMEQLMEQCSGSINPLLMSIKFSTFLSACDDILHKRTTAKCRVHYIDGQISLNELIQFAFQVQHRLASDEIGKSSGIKKIRLQNFIESLQTQFVLARTLVSLVCQNFDFAHLTIVGDIHSGPLGQCTIKIAVRFACVVLCLYCIGLTSGEVGRV